MKILIVSDTHGKNENYLKLIEKMKPFDMLIHCGDSDGGEYLICEAAECPTHIVMGNNDFFADLPREEEFEIGNLKVMVTHGHYYYVSMGVETLRTEAKARGLQVVFFGHTHKPYLEVKEDLVIMNPGSLSYPRQEGKRPSYGTMEIDESGEVKYELHFLED